MKTFNQAMDFVVFAKRDSSGNTIENFNEIHKRYECLFEEVKADDKFRVMLMTTAHLAMVDDLSPEDAVMSALATAFMNGLIVGMEMEKDYQEDDK